MEPPDNRPQRRASPFGGEEHECHETRTMTPDEQKELDRQHRQAGQRIIEEQSRRQVRTFLDELRHRTSLYRTVASLGDQVAQEYRGRAVLELLQNAHDVLGRGGGGDRRQVSFVLNSASEQPELLIANSGRPFRREDFRGICQLAQSPKDPNKSVGNKGLGFRSVLELTTRPEVWSTAPAADDIAFAFGFDPEVLEPIAQVAKRLFDRDAPTDWAFGPAPVVDWSDQQFEEYRRSLSRDGIKRVEEVRKWVSEEVEKYLSPYVLPRYLGDPPPQVARLLDNGHVTVIRLPLDGGRAETAEQAIQSVREQLVALDEAAMVFLPHLSVLRREIDEEVDELKRQVVAERTLPGTREEPDHGGIPDARHTRLRVGRAGPGATAERSFNVWSRVLGGADQPEATERIADAARHLPNRWPEVRKVEVAVAVEETREARQGALVIFLPTTKKTGIGAHVNAPSYGSLDRKTIDFHDTYNELMLEFVVDLALDAVRELVTGPAEPWRGRAVIDLLAQAGSPPSDDPELTRRLRERARDRDDYPPLEQQALILCDGGWRRPGVARTMPKIPSGDPFGEEEWRREAGFDVASSALDERRGAVKALLRSLDCSPSPQNEEWVDTLALMARQVRRGQADPEAGRSGPVEPPPDWNMFLSSVLAVLPPELRAEPKEADNDPLADAGFLPTEDGRLLSASDAVRMFFQPRHGADDAADFVGSVPVSLKERIAFLHRDVETHEGPERRRTEIQKFLDGRFVRSFRREDLLRGVVIPSLPELPAAHGIPEAAECADALVWTLGVVGQEEPEGLLPLLSQLPVACTDGWFPMKEAVFGSGWAGRSGDHLRTLADGLPGEEGEELLRSALLPPGDDRWFPQRDKRGTAFSHPHGIELANRGDQFARAGVVDGLRLKAHGPTSFWMSQASPKLPDKAPVGIPQAAWNEWREAMLPQVKPQFTTWLKHELQDVTVLPMLHRKHLGDSTRTALSNLILASLTHWKHGWDEVTIRRSWWSQQIPSPLRHWLSTLPWLDDAHCGSQGLLPRDPQPLHQCWFVPGSLLRGPSGHFRHLSPLSLQLAQRLGKDEDLLDALEGLGLNVYPTEEARTGPALLETLADVTERVADGTHVRNAMPAGGVNVLLGQIRHGWRHLDPEGDLPKRFIIRTKPRTLTVRTAEKLKDVYLPDHSWKTRLLREHNQPIMAMRPDEASKKPLRDRLVKLGARRAAGLEEHCRIDHAPSTQTVDGTQTLDAAGLGWLPVVLLALHAHGGGNPAGPATKAWRQAAARLRRARVRQCASIQVELVDAGRSVAYSQPRAHWLSPDRILVLHRDIAQGGLYDEIAAASQAILDRQDLLKDLRLVLGALNGRPQPTRGQIEATLDRAEIDAVAVANIRHLWHGETSTLVRRIRPVLQLRRVSQNGLDDAAKDSSSLNRWLSENAKIEEWPTEELLATARECYDDTEMGYRTWRVLGDAAELKEWNKALAALGGKYKQVSNIQAEAQAKRWLDEAAPLLRAFARHVATSAADDSVDQGRLFSRLNAVHESLEKDSEWPRLWTQWSQDHWDVPFGAVLDVLRERCERGSEAGPHPDVFERANTIAEFRSALERAGVALKPDPREVARGNQKLLDDAIHEVLELYETWLETRDAQPESCAQEPEVRLDDSMYLRDWSKDDLFERAKLAVADSDFYAAVKHCRTIEEMRDTLGIAPKDIEERRRRRTVEKEQDKRTVEVAGELFEIGGPVSYRELFARLRELPDPVQAEGIGPPPPGPAGGGGKRPSVSNNSEVFRRGPRTSHLHGPPDLPGLVGIVGEMHAFRFLRARFGIDTSAWVSESRTKVVPLLVGEEDVTSDSLGYDFRFTHGQVTWCVEVKATTGNSTGFDLPSSELNAATRIAPRRNERWRLLRVVGALTKQPVCYWLPNPIEPGPGERLRLLRQGGVTVEYELSENMETTAQREVDDNEKVEVPSGNDDRTAK